jgi:hypothetical protein
LLRDRCDQINSGRPGDICQRPIHYGSFDGTISCTGPWAVER